MASSRVMRRGDQTGSSVFEVDAYTNGLFHPMVRSLVLQDEEDYKSYKISFYNQMRGKSKGEHSRAGLTTGYQIRLYEEESRTTETSVNNSTGMLLPQGHERESGLERLEFSSQECVLQRENKEYDGYRSQDQSRQSPLGRDAFETQNESQPFVFDPNIEKPASWNGGVGCSSHSLPNTQDGLKPLESSRDNSYSKADPKISISTLAMSDDKKLTIERDVRGAKLKPKDTNKLTVMKGISKLQKSLICAGNRKKFHKGHSGQWSQSTIDGSSCATPSTVNCDDSRIRSNESEDCSKKNEKSWKSLSSFTQEKSWKDEWLRTSIDQDSLGTESEIEMREWLNSAVVPGWDIARQESARCGPMEMVFYDRNTLLRSNLNSQ